MLILVIMWPTSSLICENICSDLQQTFIFNMWACSIPASLPLMVSGNGLPVWTRRGEVVPLKPHTETVEGCVTVRRSARFRTSAIGRHRGVGGTRYSDSALSHRTTCLSHSQPAAAFTDRGDVLNSCWKYGEIETYIFLQEDIYVNE